MLIDDLNEIFPQTPLQVKIRALVAEIDAELQTSSIDIVKTLLAYLANRDPCALYKVLAHESDILKLICGEGMPLLNTKFLDE